MAAARNCILWSHFSSEFEFVRLGYSCRLNPYIVSTLAVGSDGIDHVSPSRRWSDEVLRMIKNICLSTMVRETRGNVPEVRFVVCFGGGRDKKDMICQAPPLLPLLPIISGYGHRLFP